MTSLTFPDFTHPEDLEADLAQAKQLLAGEIEQYEMEKRFIRKDGGIVWVRLIVGGIRDEGGRLLYFLAVLEDITGRKRMEKALRASLEEKDDLLRELSHRTKNNMQVIIALLGLQASKSKDARLAEALLNAQDRIRTMALVYEKLHRSRSISSISVKEYAEELVTSFLQAHQGTHGPVKPVLELEWMEIFHDQALPAGLILNELMSNSLKHAFPDGKPGTIFISLRRLEGKVGLWYKDDGPGLPKDVDLSRVNSLGLKLIHNLAVRQLLGSVELVPGPGTEFVFRFPLPTQEKKESQSLRSRVLEPIETQ